MNRELELKQFKSLKMLPLFILILFWNFPKESKKSIFNTNNLFLLNASKVKKENINKSTLLSSLKRKETGIPIFISAYLMQKTGKFKCDKYSTEEPNNLKFNQNKPLHNIYTCMTQKGTLNYTFKGVKFGISGIKSHNHGKFSINVDGFQVNEINGKTATNNNYDIIYTSSYLEYKEHQVSIIGHGENYEISELFYYPSRKSKRKEWEDINKNFSWESITTENGQIMYHIKKGGEMNITGNFSRIWLYGTKGPERAEISIKIGNFFSTVNTYSDTYEDCTLVYESPIIDNEDNIIIKITGNFTFYCLYYEEPVNSFYPKSEPKNDIFSDQINNKTIEKSLFEISSYEKNNFIPTPENKIRSALFKMQASTLENINDIEDEEAEESKGQVLIRNCIFRRSSTQNKKGNALYISTSSVKGYSTREDDIARNETIIEVLIENNLFNKCGETGYVNVIDSKYAIMRNNTFNFTGIECSCGGFHITKCGNITITECNFIQMKTSGIILYDPETSATEDDFLIIEQCSFDECEGVCCIIKIVDDSSESVTINDCNFNKCKAGSDQSIALQTNAGIISILDSNFNECGNEEENVFIINYQGDQNRQRYLKFENNSFYNSIGAIKVEQRNGEIIIRNCAIKKAKQSPISITDNSGETGNSLVLFNYNLIENVENVNNGFLYISKLHQFNFDHNIIKNCIFNGYSCQIDLPYSDQFTLINLTLSNCESNCQTGGGLGLWLTFKNNEGKLTFQNCSFSNNFAGQNNMGGYGGAFGSGNETNAKIELEIEGCTFEDNRAYYCGGALSLQSTQPIFINDCTFTNNKAEQGNGGAIYIHPKDNGNNLGIMPNITISSCSFNFNFDTLNIGHAIYFKDYANSETKLIIENNCNFIDNGEFDQNNLKGYTIYSEAHIFDFKDSHIKFSDMHRSTAALKIDGSGTSFITNIIFNHANSGLWNDQNMEYEAHGICISSSATSEIDSCSFEYVGGLSCKSAIFDNGKSTIINNCYFRNYFIGESRIGSVHINSIGSHTISNCYSTNGWGDNGVFIYDPIFDTQSADRNFTFFNNTVDRCYGDSNGNNNNIALNFKFNNLDVLDISNITIKNTEFSQGSIVGIELSNDITEFTLNNFKFINNKVDSNNGGSGLNINHKEPGISIVLIDCLFEGNEVKKNDNDPTSYSGYGGGLMIGLVNENISAKITMINCIFRSNKAVECGGALFILTSYPVLIESCQFEGNEAQDGGAIYINFNNEISSEEFTITGCQFARNFGQWSTSISSMSKENTTIDISNCTFNDNIQDYNIIYSFSENLKIHNMIFEFKDTNENARPICLGADSKTEIYEVQFIKCSMGDSEGTAIRAESTIQLLNVHDCSFEDCKDIGSSVHCLGSPLLFSNNIFISNEPTMSGLHIEQCSGQIEIINCSFSHLKRSKNYKTSPLTLESNSLNEQLIFSNLSFIDCYGDNLRCFSLTTNKIFTFENITVRDNSLGNYIGSIDLGGIATEDDILVFKNCKWINNSSNSPYCGGIGLWIVNGRRPFRVSFDNCLFEKNYQTNCGGAFQCGKSSSIFYLYIHILNCTFIENEAKSEGGALAIQTVYSFSIDHCFFYNNKAQNGGAIFIETTQSMENAESGSITNCTFNNNTAISENGNVLTILNSLNTTIDITNISTITNNGECRSTIYSECENLIVTGILFNFNSSSNLERNFRVAYINNGSATFDNCTFIGTGFTNDTLNGHAILAENDVQNVILNECIFTDCGFNPSHYVIYSSSLKLQFLSSVINYTDPHESCGGIIINKFSSLTVSNSIFKDIYANKTFAGGGICYNSNRNGLVSNSDVSISGCIFDNIMSNNGRAMFLRLFKYCIMNNCTIQNMPTGNYILTIGYDNPEKEKFTMERIIFIDNKASVSDDGGGGSIGFWVSQVDVCEFLECQFIRNINNKEANGGVLGYGSTKYSNSRICLEFNNCFFEDNKVIEGYKGGSLFINAVFRPVHINSCTFRNTIKDTSFQGGAIFINGETKQDISIINSSFIQIQVTSTEKSSGNAICIGNGTSHVNIEECKFLNCGTTGSVISLCYEDCESKQNCYNNRTDLYIYSCTFENSEPNEAVFLYLYGFFGQLNINKCIFDGHSQTKNACFNLSLYQNSFGFMSNIMKNFNNFGSKSYNGIIKFIDQADILNVFNMTFQNNSCSSLYGGGAGILIEGISKLTFEQCKFIDNKANQDRTASRPPIDSNKSYYNGDGGGIQLGYLSSIIFIEVSFEECIFKGNKAHRHGGGIAIQTLSTISIIKCTFEQNSANIESDSSSELLSDDHFYNHQEGKGGSIYINPSFDTEYLDNETNQISTTSSIFINECTFESNPSFDGSSIYIAGEDKGNEINITKNNFNNDDNENNKPIILSEICRISQEQLIEDNNFTKLNEKEPNILATNCKYTASQNFENSDVFTISNIFTESNPLITPHFTSSNEFSNSKLFSESEEFSNTEKFSDSLLFTNSLEFFDSKIFSESEKFSNTLIFSNSNEFWNSLLFTNSIEFSNSLLFTNSIEFSDSLEIREKLSESSIFTNSCEFSKSLDFSSSGKFSESSTFTASNTFTESDVFTSSSILTPSKTLPSSAIKAPATKKITVSKSFSLTYVNRKSVTMTYSFVSSNTYQMSYDEIFGTYKYFITQTNSRSYFPYIIYFLSPMYVEKSVIIDLTPRRRISPEQLIGVVCGSASVFFLVLGIIILALRKRNEKGDLYDDYEDYSCSTDVEIIRNNNEANQINPYEHQETIDFNSRDEFSEIWF